MCKFGSRLRTIITKMRVTIPSPISLSSSRCTFSLLPVPSFCSRFRCRTSSVTDGCTHGDASTLALACLIISRNEVRAFGGKNQPSSLIWASAGQEPVVVISNPRTAYTCAHSGQFVLCARVINTECQCKNFLWLAFSLAMPTTRGANSLVARKSPEANKCDLC